jgi:hypothetical protein
MDDSSDGGQLQRLKAAVWDAENDPQDFLLS